MHARALVASLQPTKPEALGTELDLVVSWLRPVRDKRPAVRAPLPLPGNCLPERSRVVPQIGADSGARDIRLLLSRALPRICSQERTYTTGVYRRTSSARTRGLVAGSRPPGGLGGHRGLPRQSSRLTKCARLIGARVRAERASLTNCEGPNSELRIKIKVKSKIWRSGVSIPVPLAC
jgi:hypothetical protein